MSGVEHFPPEQFEAAIAAAIADLAFETVIELWKMYASQHPRECTASYAAFEAALNGDDYKATLLALVAEHERAKR